MDFDVVEFVMEIEDHFGVRIPDRKAEQLHTVGDLYVYLLYQTREERETPCPTSRAFYKLRETLTLDLGLERHRIRPRTLLRDLFDGSEGEIAWRQLGDFLGLSDLPKLEPSSRGPTRKSFLSALFWTTQVIWLILFVPTLLGDPIPLVLAIVLWLLTLVPVCLIFGILWYEEHYLRPKVLPKVRDLVIRLAFDPSTTRDPQSWKVWKDLVDILSAHTGLPEEKIRPELDFLDMGRS